MAWVVGPVLGVLLLVKVLDIGFFTAFDRPFSPVDDRSYASLGIETLREAVGQTTADVAVVGIALLGVALLVLPTLALLRLTRIAAGHRRTSLQAVAALALAWALCWAVGAQLVSGRADRLHERRRAGRRRGAGGAGRPARSRAVRASTSAATPSA